MKKLFTAINEQSNGAIERIYCMAINKVEASKSFKAANDGEIFKVTDVTVNNLLDVEQMESTEWYKNLTVQQKMLVSELISTSGYFK